MTVPSHNSSSRRRAKACHCCQQTPVACNAQMRDKDACNTSAQRYESLENHTSHLDSSISNTTTPTTSIRDQDCCASMSIDNQDIFFVCISTWVNVIDLQKCKAEAGRRKQKSSAFTMLRLRKPILTDLLRKRGKESAQYIHLKKTDCNHQTHKNKEELCCSNYSTF